MTFLAALLTKIGIGLLSALGGWLVRHFQEYMKDRRQATEDEAKNAANRVALENAKTKEERENAAKGVADGF